MDTASGNAKASAHSLPIWWNGSGTHGRSMPASTKLRAWPPSTTASRNASSRGLFTLQVLLFVVVFGSLAMMYKSVVVAAAAALVEGNVLNRQAAGSSTGGVSSNVPQYYQTTPEFLPGPTPTGDAAFLAQTNPAPFAGTVSVLSTGAWTWHGAGLTATSTELHPEQSSRDPNPDHGQYRQR